ncbi:MAG: DUF2500 family protein [Candidatus Fimimonas sp.]
MWTFKGEYTGEARTYIKKIKQKQFTVFALVFSILYLLVFIGLAIWLSEGDLTLIIIILGVGLGLIALIDFILVLYYRREPKCDIKIKNDGFEVYDSDRTVSFAFYKIQTIDEYDDFIVIKDMFNKVGYVLQKELLIEGTWEELKVFLGKIEESLESDDPIYQIEEPKTEFFEATVKLKRIHKRFVGEVRMQHAVYEYFVMFALENGEEIEYAVGQDWYEKIAQEDVGTLVLVNGNFFSFGEGEDIE